MSAQLAQALQFIVSVVMVKQGDGAINTQNKLYSIEAVSGDEARGKAIPLAQADFPEHQFHTACFWALEAAPQQAQAPGWQLVPVEPTKEMVEAGNDSDYEGPANSLCYYDKEAFHKIWAAMLKAAPQQGSKS